jgi:hypothetical protein
MTEQEIKDMWLGIYIFGCLTEPAKSRIRNFYPEVSVENLRGKELEEKIRSLNLKPTPPKKSREEQIRDNRLRSLIDKTGLTEEQIGDFSFNLLFNTFCEEESEYQHGSYVVYLGDVTSCGIDGKGNQTAYTPLITRERIRIAGKTYIREY